MDDNEVANLDLEFKRYLQLLRPYLGHLVDEDVIRICDAWIQRLSNCKDNEKVLRNKYVFVLCYQLARGVLDRPFLGTPPAKLLPLSDDINSDDSSTEIEYIVIDSEEPKTKVLFDNKKIPISETDYFSQDDDRVWSASANVSDRLVNKEEVVSPRMRTVYCYQCPEIVQNDNRMVGDDYEFRANNLVKKLREIKMQNMLLHKELIALKEESKSTHGIDGFTEVYVTKVDNSTSPFIRSSSSSATLKSLKNQLQDIQDSRNTLIQTINNLQDQLDHFNELKKNQIEEIEAKHKLALIKVRTDAREETKSFYETKFEELKHTYDETIKKIQESASSEISTITESKNQLEFEKNRLLEAKEAEIERLKNQIEAQKTNIQSMLNRLIEKSSEDSSNEGLKFKNQLLEKRLNKLEKAKVKCAKIYEAKIALLQREKHLAECSVQLQLVRQRAQVVSELTDENQNELTASLEKLENKYKDIVANVQATAIQRRMQDQRALESLLQVACGIEEQNQSQYSNPVRIPNQTYDTENTTLSRGNRVGNVVMGNKSFGEDSLVGGFCLNGERMGELFERVYIPQRDNCNGETK
ncbi:uncharacterized protein LOC142981346 [Anticarsia gemmatalis]|uniref:uncharacterized protein LOC142981346 n=1 Tax=Anticarsia gemmatalis TaxID=129554 RepID=UPI003F76FA07